ncbi:MAG TPA: GntG family PLP-dependent aldolase [Terriglobia bacterium]|nr:GntG family PLP-dependent aldolase [Terriglobia bacterium]
MSEPIVDLRSDTVTRPTPAMRRAMAEAEVGDDVYHEDPTVNRLEERAAEIFGREAAVFVPSGTMGNQAAIKVHTQPGREVICEERAHILNFEMAMMSAFSGCLPRAIYADDGILTWDRIAPHVRVRSEHRTLTGLIEIENTSNLAGGSVYPPEIADEICDRAHAAGLPVHLDGARIFNASVALGRPVVELTRKADSVMFCLSKGLGAPVGSMLVGSKTFIEEARHVRKMLGGGMRQAGVLAAAGLVALEETPPRLHIDHENAKFLACGLTEIPGIKIDPAKVVTNILIFDVSGTGLAAEEISRRMAARGVLANATSPASIRMVTHYDVDRAGCARALNVLREVIGVPQRTAGRNEGACHLSRVIYAVDIGSTRCEAGRTPNFGWARVDPVDPSSVVGSSDIGKLADRIIRDLQNEQSVALGFEAPLFIPVPAESSALCYGRKNEGSRSFAAPAGLAVATLGLHQVAWILRRIADSCGDSIELKTGAESWPPSESHPILFCWEAFVCEKAHGTHLQDAATAAMAFLSAESNLADATTITTERPLSLLGAAALWSGLATDTAVLRQPTVVIRPSEPFAGVVRAA